MRRKKGFIEKAWIFSWFLALSLLVTGAGVGWAGPAGHLRILYLNDFHGYAEPHRPVGSSEDVGGIAHLAAEVNRLRVGQPTLLLAAGDMIQGNQWANFFQGASVLGVMNAMKFDALLVGNHEFDFGQEVLKRLIGEAAFPVLGANVEGLSEIRPYALKEIEGRKVLIIGVVTEDTPVMTHPRNVAGLAFLPPGVHHPEDSGRIRSESGSGYCPFPPGTSRRPEAGPAGEGDPPDRGRPHPHPN